MCISFVVIKALHFFHADQVHDSVRLGTFGQYKNVAGSVDGCFYCINQMQPTALCQGSHAVYVKETDMLMIDGIKLVIENHVCLTGADKQ